MVLVLMEEYKDVAIIYKQILSEVSSDEFRAIYDEESKDPDCKSIQTITEHLVESGYQYINYINANLGIEKFNYERTIMDPFSGILQLDAMMNYTETSLKKVLHLENEEIETWRYDTSWGVLFDFEQLMEHAIVHIMRHRRQVHDFLNRS